MVKLHVCPFNPHAGTGRNTCFGMHFIQQSLQMLSLQGELTMLNLRRMLTLLTSIAWLRSKDISCYCYSNVCVPIKSLIFLSFMFVVTSPSVICHKNFGFKVCLLVVSAIYGLIMICIFIQN